MPRLSPALVDILVVLASGRRHGYAIMQAVDEIHGTRRLGPAQLYTGLQKLLSCRYIQELEDPDPRKRVYEITAAGRTALAQELGRQEAFLEKAKARLSVSPAAGRPA